MISKALFKIFGVTNVSLIRMMYRSEDINVIHEELRLCKRNEPAFAWALAAGAKIFAQVAGKRGFEPLLLEPESRVLPLDDFPRNSKTLNV
jgi:hypothetical protein